MADEIGVIERGAVNLDKRLLRMAKTMSGLVDQSIMEIIEAELWATLPAKYEAAIKASIPFTPAKG